jgi:nicotinamidase/pyrazinamidase
MLVGRAPMNEADVLLLIDVQNDFCRGGALEVQDANAVVPVINRIARHFPHVVFTQDWHPPGHQSFASAHEDRKPYDMIQLSYGSQTLWPDHCIQGTHGAALHAQLDVPHAQLIVRKGFRRSIDSYSAFYENDHRTATGLGGYLRELGLSRVFIAGLALDFCVRYSAEDARREGLEVRVIEDACRGIDVNGSVTDTRRSFAALGIALLQAAELA